MSANPSIKKIDGVKLEKRYLKKVQNIPSSHFAKSHFLL